MKRIALVALALSLVGCGTRANFDGRPAARTTQVIEEIVGGADAGAVASPVGSAEAAGSTRSVTRRVTALRGGSGIRDGVIKVGGIFPTSGGLSALGVPPQKAAKAYFQWVNDHGGIGGLKIDFRTCDDKADPNLSEACTNRLVNEGIFAMGPSFTPFSPNIVQILQRKGIPWLGYDGINLEGFDSDVVVTVGAPIQTMAHALLPAWYRSMERREGRAPRRIGAVYLDVPPAKTYVVEARERICPKLGCELVFERPVNYATLLEYSAICADARQANVDTLWVVTDPASAVKLLVQCREQKYKPPFGFLGQHGVYLDLTIEQSGAWADGMIANSALLPPSEDAPAIHEMKRIVGTYQKDVDYGYFTELAYASARLTVDLIREALAIDPALGRSSVLDAAARIRSYDCHGLCRNVNLAPPAARGGGNHYVWLVRARFDRSSPDQWIAESGPIDAWRSESWPRPGRP